MAWIEARRKKDGTASYWVRDRRGGRQIVIPAGITRGEAELYLERYVIRHDLEKEGYDDGFASPAEVLDERQSKDSGR